MPSWLSSWPFRAAQGRCHLLTENPGFRTGLWSAAACANEQRSPQFRGLVTRMNRPASKFHRPTPDSFFLLFPHALAAVMAFANGQRVKTAALSIYIVHGWIPPGPICFLASAANFKFQNDSPLLKCTGIFACILKLRLCDSAHLSHEAAEIRNGHECRHR